MRRNAHAAAALLLLAALFGSGCQKTDGPPTPTAKAPPIVKTETGEMVLLPGGSFTMGSTKGQDDEAPPHTVTLDPFLIDRYEVTQALFKRCMKKDSDAHFKGANQPLENVSWPVAALVCNARSRLDGLEPCYDEDTGECNFAATGYRLPTEAEWEYAARAGTDKEYFFGNSPRRLAAHAWTKENSGKKPHPVGSKKPNPWGLFDIYGNVQEWCNDVYQAQYYKQSSAANPRGGEYKENSQVVVRGGAWNTTAATCRSAYRLGESPGQIDGCFARNDIGFRCVRRAPAQHTATARPKGE